MAEITAQEDYQQTTQFIKAILDTFAKWIKSVGDSLAFYGQTAPQREFGRWIAQYGGNVYQIQGECTDDVKRTLTEQGIPFFTGTNDSHIIIIKQEDAERIRDINRNILVARCNYYQQVDTRVMENAIYDCERIQNKDIFTLHNLNEYQTEVLKNKCNDIDRGFMIGITKGEREGFYNVAVHIDNVLNYSKKKDFCKAFLEMTFSLYGENSAIKQQQVDADRLFYKKLEEISGRDKTYYVIGVDETEKYLELSASGFEVYETRLDENSEKYQAVIARCDISNVDYERELQIQLDRFNDKALIESQSQLMQHLNTEKRNIAPYRPQKNARERQVSNIEKKMISQIDHMIKNTMKYQDFRNGDEKFSFYQSEAKHIVHAALTGNGYKNYPMESIRNISEMCKRANLDLNLYEAIINKSEKIEREIHKAEPIREKQKDREDARDDFGDR